jgi:hypothetical protein
MGAWLPNADAPGRARRTIKGRGGVQVGAPGRASWRRPGASARSGRPVRTGPCFCGARGKGAVPRGRRKFSGEGRKNPPRQEAPRGGSCASWRKKRSPRTGAGASSGWSRRTPTLRHLLRRRSRRHGQCHEPFDLFDRLRVTLTEHLQARERLHKDTRVAKPAVEKGQPLHGQLSEARTQAEAHRAVHKELRLLGRRLWGHHRRRYPGTPARGSQRRLQQILVGSFVAVFRDGLPHDKHLARTRRWR